MRKIIVFVLTIALFLPFTVSARIGVGVGIGKIEVDKPLKPGGVYDLTPLIVINTGDEPADYEITIAFQSDQTQLRPAEGWFSFNPSTFHLDSGKTQNIGVRLTLPVKTKPGDYFVYLQGEPKKKTPSSGGATIGVAAATKLYFKVIPANIWQGIYYRFIFLYSRYHPWDTIILAMLGMAVLILIFKRYFNIQIGVKKKQ